MFLDNHIKPLLLLQNYGNDYALIFDYGILFPKCNSIHTFFMKENIDIIGLDENKEVIYKYENLPKNKIIKINNERKNTSILEMPQNSTKKIRIGTILILEND